MLSPGPEDANHEERWTKDDDGICALSARLSNLDKDYRGSCGPFLHPDDRATSRLSSRASTRWSLGLDVLARRTSCALQEIRYPKAIFLGSQIDLCSEFSEHSGGPEPIHMTRPNVVTIKNRRSRLQEEQQTEWDHYVGNPQNWPGRRKWRVVLLASWLSFITFLASSMVITPLSDLAEDLGVKPNAVTALTISLYAIGSGVGGTMTAPLSEVYGRRSLYHTSNVSFAVLTLCCGFAPNFETMLPLRLLAGLLGTACMSIGAGTCVDVVSPQRRAQILSIWVSGPILGSCVGPVLGGLVAEAMSWRWSFYILSMLAGANVILCAFWMPETLAIAIQRRRGITSGKGKAEATGAQPRTIIALRDLARPLQLLLSYPVILAMVICAGVSHAVLYVLMISIPHTSELRYHFSAQTTSLFYLSPAIGVLLGIFTASQLSGRTTERMKSQGDTYTPEQSLDLAFVLPGSLAMLTGLLLYGWSVHFHVHWSSPLVGLLVFGFGLALTVACAHVYVVESYTADATSVSAASSLVSAILIALIPVTGFKIYPSLGMGWGNVLLAGVIAVSACAILVCRVKGSRLHRRMNVEL